MGEACHHNSLPGPSARHFRLPFCPRPGTPPLFLAGDHIHPASTNCCVRIPLKFFLVPSHPHFSPQRKFLLVLALIRSVMPGYFRTLRIPLKQGRDFTESDNLEKSTRRFIVNEVFARQFLGGEQPLGKKINALMESENTFGEIIGVVGDVREWSID